jgi:apolipoprotein N-acyltransferase
LSISSNLTFAQKLLLATGCGVLSYLVFPKPGLWWLAWICFVPLIIATYREFSVIKAFLFGLTAGLVFFVGTCYWITNVLRQYGGLGFVGAVFLFTLLAIYLSVFFALFAWAFATLSQRHAALCFWMAPAIWVSTEYLRGHVFTGFPWCLLGYALTDATDLAQFATVTGVYGLSFLLMIVNATVAALLLKPSKAAFYQVVGIVIGLFMLTRFLGARRPEPAAGPHHVRIVQTNINLEQRWDVESKLSLLVELSHLSRLQLDPDSSKSKLTNLILWPETPAPFYFNDDAEFRRRMRHIAASAEAHFLFGFVDLRAEGQSRHRDPYNSVALLGTEGEFIAQYDKMHLVPFGEYVPYASFFFFVEKISTEAGNFKPGADVVVAPLSENRRLGAFVCYEAIIPDLIRQFAERGAQVFVNVTNDAGFGESAAPFQHLTMARMRAIENHRYLLRAANNGISAVIDPYGRVVEQLERNRRRALQSVFDFNTALTPYTRYGDVFAWLCLMTSGLSLIRLVLVGSRKVSGTQNTVGVKSLN